MIWGATPTEWDHFAVQLGLITDLLPVVSNPEAVISPDSKMKGKGKTPSAYNARGEVAGIPKWTDRQTTARQIEKWSTKDDYGICVQTRTVRGFDIDVPDVRLADRIEASWLEALGLAQLPRRFRQGTGKRLLAFVLRGDQRKRSFKVDGGLVEFLAGGQQFIAVGTHPSGTRYEWADGLPDDIPEITEEQFEAAWAAVRDQYAIEPERRSTLRDGSGDLSLGEVEDPTADWLTANWETFGTQGGKLFVTCPWKDGHSGDSGETEAAWLLAGTGGYQMGHFECLHASCSDRTDQQFLTAVGCKPASADDFEEVAVQPAGQALTNPVADYLKVADRLGSKPAEQSTGVKRGAAHPTGVAALPLPGFDRNKQGGIKATVANVFEALQSAQVSGHLIRYDTFLAGLIITSADRLSWRPFEDADAVKLRMALPKFHQWAEDAEISKEMMRDALVAVAMDNKFDSAIEWLNNLPQWDGVERVARLYPDYFSTDDTEYTQAVGRYVMTAHVGRVLEPGCQVDMAPILIGKQGVRKSSGIMALAPGWEFFKKFDLAAKDTDQSRKMRGVLVAEFDEMRGLNGRGAEEIRSFMTRRFEDWTPKYQEAGTVFHRRMVFHGSGNEDELLNDPAGERRWLPMRVERMVDVEAIDRDRDQLWAEGYALWQGYGIMFREAERLADAEHGTFKVTDAWDEAVARWLGEKDIADHTPLDRDDLRTVDVLIGALGFEAARTNRADEMRMAKVLKSYGLTQVVRWVVRDGIGKAVRVWERSK